MRPHILAVALLIGCGPGTWLGSYDDAITELEASYAFTEHKELDWAAIDAEIRPLVASAAEQGDPEALDQAVRLLVAAIPDNHVEASVRDCPHTEGGFGLVLSDTDDEGVIVARVLREGLDLVAGERVLAWNGVPIEEARLAAPTECLAEGIATLERRAFEQLRYLATGAPGDTATVTTASGEHTLVAVGGDEAYEAFEAFEVEGVGGLHTVHHRLDDEVGVITISSVGGLRSLARMRRAMREFERAGVEAVVVDVRGNNGGSSVLCAELAGFFADERRVLEHEAFPDDDGVYRIEDTNTVVPEERAWTGPTAVLIDGFTVSSGEGVAMAAGWREDAVIVGFEGTAASFGFTGPSVSIGGRRGYYPGGPSWDADERIQLDSDATLQGGVVPEHRVPWTVENRVAYAAGEDVVMREALELLSLLTAPGARTSPARRGSGR